MNSSVSKSSADVFAVQVDRLAGDRAVPADRVDHALHHLLHRPAPRRQRRVVLRDQSVRVIEQRDRREDRQVLAELAMQRRRAAAQQRVVHRREVVEDQRRRVDHLHRRRGVGELLRLRADRLPDRDREDAAHPFAGRRQRARSGRPSGCGAPARTCEFCEDFVDERAPRGEVLVHSERMVASPPRHRSMNVTPLRTRTADVAAHRRLPRPLRAFPLADPRHDLRALVEGRCSRRSSPAAICRRALPGLALRAS